MTTYFIDKWYVEYPDGRLEPCYNKSTAQYLVNHGDAVRIVDVTRELMSA